ncbi:MAG TPA: peroxiredoxin-like family protein [bacterium]|nr:peroxiredoxin-like family protein [bacterium]
MKRILSVAALILSLASTFPTQASENTVGKVSKNAQAVAPLQKGDRVPDGVLRTVAGKKVRLKKLLAEQPSLLIFYRGSWCPYCNAHLGALQGIQKDLTALGWRTLAISPDDATHLKEMAGKHELTYTLLTDRGLALAKKFGLVFRLDAMTQEKYRKWNIKLDEASGGSNQDELPVPAAYLVGRDGTILFSHFDPDYKVRIDPKELLKAAQEHRRD